MHLGGVERSLISLLESLPKGSVQVNLFLCDQSGDLLSQIPADVNLLPPSPWYLALCLPIVRVLSTKQFLIGLSRLFAKAVRFIRGLLGLAPGFLLTRSYRYAGVFLPKIPGEYDLAISFLKPHDFVISKARA
ncbi:MAG: glycosyltransferase, partial [bacterium]